MRNQKMKTKTITVSLFALLLTSQNQSIAQPPFQSAAKQAPVRFLVIDKSGNTQFSPIGFVSKFSGGRAEFHDNKTQKSGYLDKRGNIAIAADFSRANPFSEGLATVVWKSKWVIIDKAGTVVVKTDPTDFIHLGNFSDGLCLAIVMPNSKYYTATQRKKSSDSRLRFKKLDDTLDPFSTSIGAAPIDAMFGFIDKFGKMTIPPRFDWADSFSDGLAMVVVGEKHGFIDKTGNQVIAPTFDSAHDFSESLAGARKGKLWGFIDKAGQFVIQPQYSKVRDFKDGLAAVQIKGKWGFVDRQSKLVVPATFAAVSDDFSNGLAACAIDQSPIAKVPGFIRSEKSDTQRVREFEKERTSPYPLERYFPENLKWGLIDKRGNFVVKPTFDAIGPGTKDGLRRVTQKSLSGYINNAGVIAIPIKFFSSSDFSEGLAEVTPSNDKFDGFIREQADQINIMNLPLIVSDTKLIQKDIAVCDQAIRIDASNRQALFDRAYLLAELERYPEAIAAYSQLLKIHPHIKLALQYRGETYIKSGKFREAEADFTLAIKSDLEDSTLYHRRGVARTNLKDYKGALADLNMAVKLHPYPDYYQARSIVYEALGNMEQAERDAIEGGDYPANAISQPKLQTVADLKKEFEKKRSAFSEMQKNPSKFPRFRRWKAAKDTQAALDRLMEATSNEMKVAQSVEFVQYNLQLCHDITKLVNPASQKSVQEAYRQLCRALLSSYNCAEILKTPSPFDYLNEAIKLAQEHDLKDTRAEVLMFYGRALDEKGDIDGANAKFQEAIAIEDGSKPGESFYRDDRRRRYAAFLKKHGRMSAATAELSKMKANDATDFFYPSLPDPPIAPPDCTAQQYYDLAVACKGVGLVAPARDYIQKAIARSKDKELTRKAEIFFKHRLPKHDVSVLVNAKHHHAHSLEDMQRLDSAEKYYRECMKDDPKFEYPYFCLARVLRTQGRLKEAKPIIDAVIKLNPDYFGGWMELGMYEAESKNKTAAIAAFKKALELDPADEVAKLELSKLGN